jgi:uncharacterized protein involved in outer membrane biogenesis
LSFTWPGTLQSADVDTFLGWLKGRGDQPAGQSRSLNARGVVTFASDRLAVDQLTAAFDQQTVEGRLAYTWETDKTTANLDAEVRAAALDLDALSTFGKAALAGDGLPLPREATLALDVGRATLGGVNGQAIKARVKVDAGVLQIDKFSVGELGGASLDISGRIDELSSQPRGRLTLNLNARALTGLADVVGKFAPQSADLLRRFADRLAPATVRGTLTVDRGAAKSSAAKLDLDGQMGALHVTLNGTASGVPSSIGKSIVRVATELDASDSSTLVGLFGLDGVVAVAPRAGRMTLSATGPLDGDFKIDGQLSAGGLDGAVQGTMRLTGDQAPTGAMQVLASASDFRPLIRTMTGQTGASVPASGRAALAVNGKALSLTDLAVTVGKSSLRGRLALNLAKPLGIDGDIQADSVDAASVSALLLGQPSKTDTAGGLWSSEPFADGAFSAASGTVRFKFDRAAFAPALTVSDLKGTAQFRPAEITLSDIDGGVADGRVTGELAFRRDKDGLTMHARGELAGAHAAALFPALSKNAIDGPLTIKLQSDSVGQSPLGFIGFLRGSGAITLNDAQIAGLDSAAFDAAVHTADQSGAIEAPKILGAVNAAMANGRLTVPHGDAAFVINAGRLSLQKTALQTTGGTTLSLAGTLDLATAALDGRATLSAKPAVNALISLPPELSVTFQGPLGAPTRAVDVTALVGWLALRAAELQTRRIESIEANRRPEAIGPLVRPEAPTIRTAPAGTVVESEAPADVAAPGSRGFDRLQAEPAPAPAAVSVPPVAKPVPLPPRSNKATSNAETTDQIRLQPVPQPTAPAPAARSGFDFLFRPQN